MPQLSGGLQCTPYKVHSRLLLYLFQDRNLQPGTIDGYRSAIADKLENLPITVSKDKNLTCLLDSFHRDRSKGWRSIHSWNLSFVLHQLSKAPFEPLKEAFLKHLTFKTVFLLPLGSGENAGTRSMLGSTKTLDIRQTRPRCLCTLTQLSFKESASQGGSRQCDPSGYSGPNSG